MHVGREAPDCKDSVTLCSAPKRACLVKHDTSDGHAYCYRQLGESDFLKTQVVHMPVDYAVAVRAYPYNILPIIF